MGFWDVVKDGMKEVFSPSSRTSKYREESPSVRVDTKYQKVLNKIKQFKPLDVIDERDLENQLYQFLVGKFTVKQYVQVKHGKIDLVVEGVGVELKLADSSGNVRELVSQVLFYKKSFQHLICVILDVGKVRDMDDYVKELRKIGAQVIIVKGRVNRRKKNKQIIINT